MTRPGLLAFLAILLIGSSSWGGPKAGSPNLFSVTLDSASSPAPDSAAPRVAAVAPDSVAAAPIKADSVVAVVAKADTLKSDTSKQDTVKPQLQAAVVDSARLEPLKAENEVIIPKANVERGIFSTVFGSPVRLAKWIGRTAGFRWIVSRLSQLGILVASIALIMATVLFYMRREDKLGTLRFLTTTRLSVMDKEVQRACRYVEKNHVDPDLTPDKLCEDLVTGRAFIEALFERELGMTVAAFINQVRVNSARLALSQDPQASTEEISLSSGFRTESEFLAAFQEISGTSFQNFRMSSSVQKE